MRFTNQQRLGPTSQLTASQRIQTDARAILSDEPPVTYVDVIEDGVVRYQGYFYSYGEAIFFEAGTTRVVASACQHSIDHCPDKALWLALGDAYEAADPPIETRISFAIPAPRVEHERLGVLEYDDNEDQWRGDIEVDGGSVRIWVWGDMHPRETALRDAVEAISQLDALTARARAACGDSGAVIAEVALWKPGVAYLYLRTPGESSLLEVELPLD